MCRFGDNSSAFAGREDAETDAHETNDCEGQPDDSAPQLQHGRSVREVADRLGISKSTVTTYLYRARGAGLVVWPLPVEYEDDRILERALFGRRVCSISCVSVTVAGSASSRFAAALRGIRFRPSDAVLPWP